jgi:hypothetical protein
LISKMKKAFLGARELGWRSTGWYALYQLGLRTGHYRRESQKRLQSQARSPETYHIAPLIDLPEPGELAKVIGVAGRERLLAEAEEIQAGQVRLFGAVETGLAFGGSPASRHWTEAAPTGSEQDIKLVWEPARFGWVFTLGRAYRLTGDERLADSFWKHFESFQANNPAELGLHWVSAQEVALRLIAFAFAVQVFEPSLHTTHSRMQNIARAIEAHARRIPPTLLYARAQRNNHLLTESAGLYTAGCALPDHPEAATWRKLGLSTFEGAVLDQFSEQGEYSQHSTNYQRLALQISLWMSAVMGKQGQAFRPQVRQRLAAGTRWLLRLVDAHSGGVPNLGPNDGAYLFPFTSLAYGDYRPVLQAAACEYLGQAAFPNGEWDEIALWLKGQPATAANPEMVVHAASEDPCGSMPYRLESADHRSWAYFRTARFTVRPGHADQLHVDLWANGENLAIDAGTYLYNAPPPWDNSLASAFVHNTVTVDGQDQMTRAGKFLYLDWAQAKVTGCRKGKHGALEYLEAQHNGYRKLGIVHERSIEAVLDGWRVVDRVVSIQGDPSKKAHTARLHWLLPDLPWKCSADNGIVRLNVETQGRVAVLEVETHGQLNNWRLARSGTLLAGEAVVLPYEGWTSPTYAVKGPALSLAVEARGELPVVIMSSWKLG